MENEIWKDIKGFEGLYKVSNKGNVKSLNYLNHGITKIIKPSENKDGYLRVVLCKNKKKKYITIHRLVANSFFGDYNNMFVDHIDRNRKNNNVDNLRYVNPSENSKNRSKTKNKKYKGISFKDGKWVASIKVNKKTIHLGSYNNEIEAALSYDRAAIKFGYTTNNELGLINRSLC